MVGSIIARSYGDGTRVKLSLRLATPTIHNAIALDMSVDPETWQSVNKSLKYYAQAYRRGTDFEVDGGLRGRLWSLLKAIDAMNDAGTLTLDGAREEILARLRPDVEQETVVEVHRITMMEWIRTYIHQCETGERLKQRSSRQISLGTIRSLKGTLSQLEGYQDDRHRIVDFDDVSLDFYDDWRRYFVAKGYSPNTIGRHVKNLKTFLRAAKDMKLTDNTAFESARFAAESVDVENVYLTDERVQELYVTDFNDPETVGRILASAPDDQERAVLRDQLTRRTPRLLNEAKDIFLVGCLTGQRVSDYKRICDSMIRRLSDDNDYIYLQQAKTNKWIYIPMDLRVRAILARYGGSLPKIYDQDLNERIKVVGRLMGWRENAGIKEYHGNTEVQTDKRFYECIKTHTARRTFATNAYKRRISLSAIMIITGHSSEKMLRKYLKLDNEERAMMAAAEFARHRREE